MNENGPNTNSAIERDPDKASDVAELVRRDFTALLRIFDEQLANLSAHESDQRPHLHQAKVAAERGLKLSEQLIEMLRASN
jgi:hypothetical protein